MLIKNKDNHSISNIKFSSKNRSRENQSKKTLNFLRPRIDQRNPSKKGIKKLLQIAAAFFIANCGKILLKNELAFLLQNAPVLLQNAAVITKRADFITKRGRYYKTRRLLQNAAVHM